MSNLYEILQNAQDGQALENLAKQFNISKEEADAAAKELLPALSTGFLSKATEPGALGLIIGALGEGQHLAAFADPAAAQSQATAQKGDEIVAHLFGSGQINEQVVQRASAATGLKPELLTQMLPVIASVILGGVTKSLQGQGYGGIFTQLVNAARQGGLNSILGPLMEGGPSTPGPRTGLEPSQGSAGASNGLGSILGQLLRAGAPSANPPQQGPGSGSSSPSAGGFGAILGALVGNLLGRLGAPTAPPAPGAPGQTRPAPGLDASAIQAALETLTKMLQPGTPPTSRALHSVENEPPESVAAATEPHQTGQTENQSRADQPREPGASHELRDEIGQILDRKGP